MTDFIISKMREAKTLEELKKVFELSKKLVTDKKEFMKINAFKNHRKEELLLPF